MKVESARARGIPQADPSRPCVPSTKAEKAAHGVAFPAPSGSPAPVSAAPREDAASASVSDPAPAPGRGADRALWLLVGVALFGALLRVVEAASKSLWLDELHSIWTGQGATLAEVCQRVSQDFHPPLYFVWLHFLDGVDAHLLRGLTILASLATLWQATETAEANNFSTYSTLGLPKVRV